MPRTSRFSSRGAGRPRREFDWIRTVNTFVAPVDPAINLFEQYEARPGSDQTSNVTVMRIRGIARPNAVGTFPAGTLVRGVIGIRVEPRNYGEVTADDQPLGDPDEDWMAWLPYILTSTGNGENATWNDQASIWAVDVKANRKVPARSVLRLRHDFEPVGAGAPTDVPLDIDLSVGVKLS